MGAGPGTSGTPNAAADTAPRRHRAGLARPVAGAPVGVWAVGLAGTLLVLGPALGPGSLLNLDLVVVSDPPVPPGMWGLGPELPRRVPLWGPLAWVSAVLGGELVARLLLVSLLTLAFVGAWRLVARLSAPAAAPLGPWLAGTLYAFGPFLATRTAVGHLLVTWVMALLPWAVRSLLAPISRRPAALLWAAALGLGGVFGGVLAGAFVVAGFVVERSSWTGRPRRAAWTVALLVATQLPWLVPLLIVGVGGDTDLARGSDFAPTLDSVGGAARVIAGQGFWNDAFQIGRDLPLPSALAGLVLLAAAILGWSRSPAPVRGPLTVVAGISLVVAVSTALPGVDELVDRASGTFLGAPFRDSQRQLVPFLLWLAVCAGFGVDRLLRHRATSAAAGAAWAIAAVLPFAAVLVLAVPAAWGFGGQLRPVDLPPEWAEARAAVAQEPGTVLALPWFEYFTLDVNRDRLTLGIVPWYLGGDVLAASDPRLSDEPRQESADPRLDPVAEVLDDARAGVPVADRLTDLGVRWVAVQHDVDWQRYTGVLDDPGLERVVSGPSLDLYRVRGWAGPVRTDEGDEVGSSSVVAPLLTVDPSGPATLARPYQPGWLRGWSAAGRTDDGLVALPGGSGIVWYWPALVVLAADVLALTVVVVAARSSWREDRGKRSTRGNA